jgi:hypothetical protein
MNVERFHRLQAEHQVMEGRVRLKRQYVLVSALAPNSRLLPLAKQLLANMQRAQRLRERYLTNLVR